MSSEKISQFVDLTEKGFFLVVTGPVLLCVVLMGVPFAALGWLVSKLAARRQKEQTMSTCRATHARKAKGSR